MPAGAHVTTLAGIAPLAQPRAAWRAVQRACATAGHVSVGVEGAAAVSAACPAKLDELPAQALLPDDVLSRLGLLETARRGP